MVDANPATDLSVVAAPAKAARHHPHVAFTELPELLGKCESANIHTLTRQAIKLLVLTAVRPGELCQAPWSEFDLDGALWTIPAARMKTRRPHVGPLPQQAVDILRQLQDVTGRYTLVFAGANPERPMSENTVNKTLRRMGYWIVPRLQLRRSSSKSRPRLFYGVGRQQYGGRECRSSTLSGNLMTGR